MRSWLGALLLCAACSPVRDPIELPPGAAYVLGFVREEALEVFAVDGDGSGLDALPAVVDYRGEPSIELVLYTYDVPLAELSMVAGPLPAATVGGRLPPPARRGIRQVDADGSGAWALSAGETDDRLEAFRSERLPRSGCVSLASRVLRLEQAQHPVVAILPDGDDAIVITNTPEWGRSGETELWRVRTAGTATVTRIDGVAGLDEIRAIGPIATAARGDDGRMWLAVGGRSAVMVFVGTPEDGFRPIGRQGEAPAEWPWWMLVEPRSTGDVLWTLTDYGSVNRYDEASALWTRIDGNGPPSKHSCASPTLHCGGLARALDGTIVIADQRFASVAYRVRGDTLVEEMLPPSSDPLTRLVTTPLGPVLVRSSVLSTSFTRRDETGRWVHLSDATGNDALVIQRTYEITGWRDGFVASGVYGFALQRTPTRYCDAIDGVSPQSSTAHMVGLPNAVVFATGFSSVFTTVPPSVAVARAVEE